MIAILLLTLAVCIIIGIPIAFSIGISTLVFLLCDGSIPLMILTQKMVDGLNSFTLMALPLFILSGGLMGFGSTPRIMNLANMLLSKKRWGIGSTAVVSCAAFGTISGSGVATASAIGSIVSPEMTKQGYPRGLTASLVAGAGTLGAVIPPSCTFVIYASMTGASVSDLFAAGIIPGCLTALLLCALNKRIVLRNNLCQNKEVHQYTSRERRKIILDAILPLLTPVIILGGTFSGLLTPTEAASVAVVYAFILSTFVYHELTSIKQFITVCRDCVITSSVVLLIISFAMPFAWVLSTQNVDTMIGNWVLAIGNNKLLVYTIVVIIILIMGTFMEGTAIILLTTPIFLPILTSLGVDPVSYGVVLNMAICVGAVTPPLAVTLFTACRIVNINVEDTFPHILYVLVIMVISTFTIVFFPKLATFLPSIIPK